MPRVSTITEEIECPSCGHNGITKAGIINGTQRYKCKSCGTYFFTEFKRKRRSAVHHKTAALMFIAGAKTKEIEQCLDASYTLVSKWTEEADTFLTKEPEIAALKVSSKKDAFTVKSLNDIPERSKKRWLVIELDEDVADGESIVITKKSK